MPPTGTQSRGPTAVDPLVGKVLADRFRIIKLVARGGMGKVYQAEQLPLGRICAVKTLDIIDQDGEFRKRFFLEASLCAKLAHPNTVRVFDYGATDDGVYFIAMEYLEGRTFRDLIKREAPLPPLRAISIIRQICGALSEAHDKGIIHRDMKPANVFLTPHGDDQDFAKILDFGLVKDLGIESQLSQHGQVMGSPLYMPPEQVELGNIDQRTDIYAVGLMLYIALCGQMPFKIGNNLAVMIQQLHKEPPTFAAIAPDVSIPASLEWVVRVAVKKDQEHRFANMREFSRALKFCEREIRGEIPGPLNFDLHQGRLIIPDRLAAYETHSVTIPPEGAMLATSTSGANETISGFSSTTIFSRPSAPVAVGAVLLIVLGVVGGAVLVSGLAVTASFWIASSPDVVESPEPVGTPEPVVVEPPPVPVEAAKEIQLSSDPSGAEVYRGKAFMGTTPLPLNLKDGESRELTLKRDGYEDRVVLIDGSVPELSVPLKKKRRAGTASPKPPPKPAEGTETPAPDPKPSGNNLEVRDPWEN